MIKDIHFANPTAIYFLVFTLAIILLLGYSLSQRRKSLKSFADASSLASLLFLEKRTLVRYILLASIWFCATIALMQPETIKSKQLTANNNHILDEKIVDNNEGEKTIVKRRSCDLIFLLDVSASMQVQDTRQKCSRLEAAKEIIDETVSRLDGQNVALYTFTSALTPVVPLTLDYFFTRLMLKDVGINYGDIAGTDLFEALDQTYRKHFLGSQQKQKVLVLLTDGGDTYLDSLSPDDRKKQLEVMLNKISSQSKTNERIFTIGLGSKEKSIIPGIEFEGKPVVSSLDSELLSELSQKSNGKYFFANDYSAVAIADHILKIMRAENSYIEQEIIPKKKLQRSIAQAQGLSIEKKNLFQWPLGLALLLLAFELILPLWPVRKEGRYE